MNRNSNKGFTLTELVVVLVIISILAAAAIPSAIHYIKLAEFRKNESNAKTAYLAAEASLTWYRTSGEWDEFRREVIYYGTCNSTFTEADPEHKRIYLITMNGGNAPEPSKSENQVRKLLGSSIYDQEFLSGSIGIEIDVETGQVYSAFYGTHCRGLAYDGAEGGTGVWNINAGESYRGYDNRRSKLLGYYSVEDVVNVVELKPIRLKVTTINLVNGETLSLNWSGNSRHKSLDVAYDISFYNKGTDQELFSTEVDLYKLGQGKWIKNNEIASLTLVDAEKTEVGDWNFPLTYQEDSGRFSLVLDGMMSSELMEVLNAKTGAEGADITRKYSTSITRLAASGSESMKALAEPLDLYAVITVRPTYAETEGDFREYRESSPLRSNEENTLFANARIKEDVLEADITRFRHLSNIRYYDQDKEADFVLAGRNMDWTLSGVGMYELKEADDGSGKMELLWGANGTEEAALDFPSIRLLSARHSLTGKASSTSLANLCLGADSMPKDEITEKLYGADKEENKLNRRYTRYVGLFGEIEGRVSKVTFQNPVLSLEILPEEGVSFDYLWGAGILCGRSQGALSEISVLVSKDKKGQDTVKVLYPKGQTRAENEPLGVGGIAGILAAAEDSDKTLKALDITEGAGQPAWELVMEGSVTANLPEPQFAARENKELQEKAAGTALGVGGIFGYGWTGEGVTLTYCQNHADVTGNLFAGGIGGRLTGIYDGGVSAGESAKAPVIKDCFNDGLILCSQDGSHEEAEARLEGRYFGGILGFAHQARVETSTSISGRSSGYEFSFDKKDVSLVGQYVGGILGYGSNSCLSGCSTSKGGYILGSDYVGGIAGGLSNDAREAIMGMDGVTVTINASYVIGNSYVGGIVGKNGGDGEDDISTTIIDCINNGVAAGYGRYIGGIAGYNGKTGELKNCASYLSDYDHSIFNQIVHKWQAAGSCVGGLAGYNNGKVVFEAESESITVKSVSSVVVGKDYVGGIIGFNDREGSLDVSYSLIGGQVYGFGDGAGGCIGLNASEDILTKNLTIRPSGVRGQYCVGGCIGANVVELFENVKMDRLRADNVLGSISGKAFTGGVIGYQRTYTSGQLGGQSVRDYLLEGKLPRLLPELEENRTLANVLKSNNSYSLTLSNDINDAAGSLENMNNNIPIRSDYYAGGIVGYCEKNSLLILKNCRNGGSIERSIDADPKGVSLKEYLEHQEIDISELADEEDVEIYMTGGMISSNLDNQVIDHCSNTGSISGVAGLGGIVGFNAGGVFNCELSDNFGNASLNYIGGIVGLNIHVDSSHSGEQNKTYRDFTGREWSYSSGTIAKCSTRSGRTISGHSYVGGIAGWNLKGGILKDNENQANVTAYGNYAGGIAGGNSGVVQVSEDTGMSGRFIQGMEGIGIGGIAGWNKKGGVIAVDGHGTAGDEVVAVGSHVSVTGFKKAGGIVGIHEGILKADEGTYLTCRAALVRTREGYTGGIAGSLTSNDEEDGFGSDEGFGEDLIEGGQAEIIRARNQSDSVTADRGSAGGIVAVNLKNAVLRECENTGSVSSDQGYAGGIAAENYGELIQCFVGEEGKAGSLEIRSEGSDALGAVCAVNYESGRVLASVPLGGIRISGDAGAAGGVAGRNLGYISGEAELDDMKTVEVNLSYMPELDLSSGDVSVGGVAGENGEEEKGDQEENWLIENITVGSKGIDLTAERNYQYLGGIAGRNQEGAKVEGCTFSGTITEDKGGTTGACYGGIAGDNKGEITECRVKGITMTIDGVYTATSTSTAAQKEALSSHAGGVAGKNDSTGEILGCLIEKGSKTSRIEAESGMAGGIVGYNKGSLRLSGDAVTEELMAEGAAGDIQGLTGKELADRAELYGIAADDSYVTWNGANRAPLENFVYDGSNRSVSSGRSLVLILSVNGNLGGITAYNGPEGKVDYCATGDWYLNNKSDAIGVGTGGIIGMNESEEDLSFLLNQAFVGRQLSSNDTNRFAGGIIGNQNNTTRDGWKLKGCVNYGTVYCLRTHYSGGVLGQWTGTGGTLEQCYNYGNLQTTYGTGWVGASGGIVAQLYHAYEGNEYNIISCGNYGNIFGQTGRSNGNCANDSAGILGNVTAYESGSAKGAQNYTIQVMDCVNGSGVEIYSNSMASGIVGFFSCDNPRSQEQIGRATGNIKLHIERCRNFAAVLTGGGGNLFVGGIFGERYGADGAANTVLKNCYSVHPQYDSSNNSGYYYRKKGYPIVSYDTNSQNVGKLQAEGNYFFSDEPTGGINSFSPPGTTAISDTLKRAGTGCAYLISYNSEDYAVALNPGTKVTNLQIEKDKVYRGTDRKLAVGTVLFKLSSKYGGLGAVLRKESSFDEQVRYAYHKTESSNNIIQEDMIAGEMMLPKRVDVKKNGSQLAIQVEPWPGSDPFKYEASLYAGSKKIMDFEFYSDTYTLKLPKSAASYGDALSVQVRSCSMFEDVEPSEWRDSEDSADNLPTLPEPELRIELDKNENDELLYRFSLANQESYLNYGDKWHIAVDFMDGTASLEMSPDGYGGLMGNYLLASKNSLQQLRVQAVSQDADVDDSSQISVPTYLPAYTPEITLGEKAGLKKAVPGCQVSGTNFSDIRITAALDASGSGNVTTPPVYRAELIGTWKDGDVERTAVFMSRDILTASNGKASAVFTDLPSYLADVEDLHVRVWYAEPGLGPVYTYYPVDLEEKEKANIFTYTGEDTNAWTYAYSPVLEEKIFDNQYTFEECRWVSQNLIVWLPYPVLAEDVAYEENQDKRLEYTFSWDEDTYQQGDIYLVSLTGIRKKEEGGSADQIVLLSGKEVEDCRLTIDAEDWDYDEVELTVTRKGEEGRGELGRSSVKTYLVRKRLPRPSQPKVTNPDIDELFYEIQWDPVRPEDGCSYYDVYFQPYEEDGTSLEEAVLIVDGLEAGEENKEDEKYKKTVNLEAYAGRKGLIFVVARPSDSEENTQYVRSVDGITTEIPIPARVAEPSVSWSKDADWVYEKEKPLSMKQFMEEKLKVMVTANDAQSIPSGDSGYLLKAYVFDTEDHARAAMDTLTSPDADGEKPEGLLAYYPGADGEKPSSPVMMETDSSTEYSHILTGIPAEYAGKYILCSTRISAGDGQVSSKWVLNPDIWQLPYIKLETPKVLLENQERKVTVTVKANPDLDGEEEEWTADAIVLTWDSEEPAKAYGVTLTGKDGQSRTYKLVEDGDRVAVYEKDESTDAWIEGDLSDYTVIIDGQYEEAQLPYTYEAELSASLQVKKKGDGFTYQLILPDADRLKPKDDVVIRDSILRPTQEVTVWAAAEEDSDAFVDSDEETILLEASNDFEGDGLLLEDDVTPEEKEELPKEDLEDKTEESRPEEDSTESEEGESQPEEGSTESEEGESQPEEGSTESEGGESQPEEGSTESEEGESQPEEGSTESEEGESQPEEGSTESEEGESQPEEGSTESEEGESQPEDESAESEEGESQPEEESTESKEESQPETGSAESKKEESQPQTGSTESKKEESQPEEESMESKGGESQPKEESMESKAEENQPEGGRLKFKTEESRPEGTSIKTGEQDRAQEEEALSQDKASKSGQSNEPAESPDSKNTASEFFIEEKKKKYL